jgi:hypothetical protein
MRWKYFTKLISTLITGEQLGYVTHVIMSLFDDSRKTVHSLLVLRLWSILVCKSLSNHNPILLSIGKEDVGRDSSVGPGIESWYGRDFPKTSRPALGATQPLIQWVRGFVCRCFVTNIGFHSEELLAPRPTPSWRTTPRRLHTTVYSIYSQLPSILEDPQPEDAPWSCLEIRLQHEVTVWRLIIIPSRGWKSSNIWEQP